MSSSSEVSSGESRLTITTSWDDGHPLDLRIAELLAKYGLPGTFYVPLHNSRATMLPAQIRELASAFEIGAHTVNHIRLTTVTDDEAKHEIHNSKQQLEDILGRPCAVFCFPGGRYEPAHLRMVSEAGFHGVRTTELLSLRRPQIAKTMRIIPTTIQAFPHRRTAYLRNALKRLRLGAIRNLFLGRHLRSWPEFAGLLLERAAHIGGVFHLWGHSWEIEETRQWQSLDLILARISEYRRFALLATNARLCCDD